MKRLVLVDGNALLHRAYHATPPLTTSAGELINAVYGFSLMILRSLEELNPDFMAVAWDEKGPTFRHQAYTQYKANRTPTDDGLLSQYKRVHEVVGAFNIPEFKVLGYEADDLIGTLARQAEGKEKNLEVIILTGDRDIMQLIDNRIKVLMPKKVLQDVGLFGEEEFAAKWGFDPKLLIDYKALAGDASDNIPGVEGIGDITATKLIQNFGPIEKIYKPQNLKTLPPRTQTLLAEGAESAVLSKKLATIDTDSPIKLDLLKCRVKDFDKTKVEVIFKELEFSSLLEKLNLTSPSLKIISSQNQSTTDLDLEVEKVLEEMSRNGVLIDLDFLKKLDKDLTTKLKDIEKQIYSSLGHQININSPKQLAQVLFEELGLPVIRKTKTGLSTDEDTLHELSLYHPIVPLLLAYRQLYKLVSTYVEALPKYIGQDGRIHSTFNVEGAATGRLSSENPNLQNIPIKGEMGGEIRRAFMAPKDALLLGADYSQIELRILAHMADDPGLKKAFQENIDIHASTAAKIFKIPLDQVDKNQRMIGKTMNFATLYGQGPHALSRQLGVDYKTAQFFIEEYFNQFPKVRAWKEKVLQEAKERGFAETLWGRRRYIPELSASDKRLKSFGERAAINHPVQGTAADMVKQAMVDIHTELANKMKNSKLSILNCKLILQVHDELLFECSEEACQDLAQLVKQKMENALKLSVPIVVEMKVGKTWGEMTKL